MSSNCTGRKVLSQGQRENGDPVERGFHPQPAGRSRLLRHHRRPGELLLRESGLPPDPKKSHSVSFRTAHKAPKEKTVPHRRSIR